MARVLTVTANPLLDFLSREALQPGRVTRSAGFTPMAAGKGINVARVLHRHGHQVQAAFLAGGQTGAMLGELIAADGIDPLLVPIAARTRVGFICAASQERPQGALLEGGFHVDDSEATSFAQVISDRIDACDLLIISGSLPDPSVAGCYAQLCDRAQQSGVPCWVDSYGPGMAAALEAAAPPLLAKPNRQEYSEALAWDRCRELHISDGGARLQVHYGDERYMVIPPSLEEVNPVGSGDCYVAGLAHARLQGWEYTRQLDYAVACGAANAARWDVAQIDPAIVAPYVAASTIEQQA